MDGMIERVVRLEERTDLFGRQLDRILTRLDSLDGRLGEANATLARLPSRDFLVTSILACLAIVVAAAIGIGALTFQVADYAVKQGGGGVAAPVSPAPAPPAIIVLPGAASRATSNPAGSPPPAAVAAPPVAAPSQKP